MLLVVPLVGGRGYGLAHLARANPVAGVAILVAIVAALILADRRRRR